MSYADEVRMYALVAFIQPARERGQPTVTFTAKDIHIGLGYKRRYSLVCSAIDADKFLDYANVTLLMRGGPEQSSTVEWTFLL